MIKSIFFVLIKPKDTIKHLIDDEVFNLAFLAMPIICSIIISVLINTAESSDDWSELLVGLTAIILPGIILLFSSIIYMFFNVIDKVVYFKEVLKGYSYGAIPIYLSIMLISISNIFIYVIPIFVIWWVIIESIMVSEVAKIKLRYGILTIILVQFFTIIFVLIMSMAKTMIIRVPLSGVCDEKRLDDERQLTSR